MSGSFASLKGTVAQASSLQQAKYLTLQRRLPAICCPGASDHADVCLAFQPLNGRNPLRVPKTSASDRMLSEMKTSRTDKRVYKSRKN